MIKTCKRTNQNLASEISPKQLRVKSETAIRTYITPKKNETARLVKSNGSLLNYLNEHSAIKIHNITEPRGMRAICLSALIYYRRVTEGDRCFAALPARIWHNVPLDTRDYYSFFFFTGKPCYKSSAGQSSKLSADNGAF